jgi:cell division protein FtsQ
MSTVSVDPRIRARRVEVARDAGRRRLRRLTVLGVVLGIAAIGVAITFSPALDVEHIAVTSAGHYRRAALLDAAGVAKGDPLPWLDTGDAERGLEALPWIDQATVERTWSGSVSISVTERTAVAAVASGDDRWLLVDGTGRLLQAVDAEPTDVPLIDAETADGELGDTLDAAGIDAATVAAGVPSSLRADIGTISGSGSDLAIALRTGGAIVMGGADDAAAKLSAAAAVLATVSPGCVEQLDVSVASAPALISVPGCT